MSPPAVRLVVFDLGGVLVRICRSWAEACGRAGVPVRDGASGADSRARRQAAVRAYDVGAIDDAGFHLALSAAMDGLYAPEEVERVHHAWLLGEYAGVPGLFDALDAAPGVLTGLLSNTNEAHWRRMVPGPGRRSPEFPSLHRARHPHASHRLGLVKPDPEVFRRFESLAGFRGAEIVFFDDLPENVEAARAAGWLAHPLDPAGDPPGEAIARLTALGVL